MENQYVSSQEYRVQIVSKTFGKDMWWGIGIRAIREMIGCLVDKLLVSRRNIFVDLIAKKNGGLVIT